MPNPAAILVITLLPAVIYLTVNYTGDGIQLGGLGGGGGNQTIKIEFGENGSISVGNLGIISSGRVSNLSKSEERTEKSVQVTEGFTSEPEETVQETERVETTTPIVVTTARVTTPRVTTQRVTTPKVTTPRVTTPRVTTQRVTTPRVTTQRVTTVVTSPADEDSNEIRSSSVVKKSIVNVVIPTLPTCCDLRVKKSKSGGRKILSYCDGNGSGGSDRAKESGVWEVPQELLLRKDGPKIFRLQKHQPSCQVKKYVILDLTQKPEDHFLSNGILKIDNEYYPTDDYCLNGFEEPTKLEVHICEANCSNGQTPCVQKCCEYDEVYSLGMKGKRGGCLKLEPNETLWSPTFYGGLDSRLSGEEQGALRPHIVHTNPASFKPFCVNKLTTVYPYGQQVVNFLNSVLKRNLVSLPFQLRKDGWLMHPNKTSKGIAIKRHSRTTKYCIDGVQNYGEEERFSNLERQSVLFVCTIPDHEEEDSTTTTSTSTSTATSTSTTTSTTPKPTKSLMAFIRKAKTVLIPPPTTTTTTTTEKPKILPKLPTCCHLNPSGDSNHCLSFEFGDNSSQSVEWMAAPKFMNAVVAQTFKLEPSSLKCKDSWNKAFILNYDNLPGGGSPSLMGNGMLKFQEEYFTFGEFCVNGIFSNIIEVLMCKTNCAGKETPCINKCCGPREIYSLGADGGKRGCMPLREGDEEWTPSLWKDMDSKVGKEERERMTPHLVHKFPPKFQYTCYKNLTLVFPYKKEVVPLMSPLAKINLQFRLRQDGKVIYRHPVIKDGLTGKLMESVFNDVEYCVDGIRNYGEGSKTPYKTQDENAVLFVCAMNPPL